MILNQQNLKTVFAVLLSMIFVCMGIVFSVQASVPSHHLLQLQQPLGVKKKNKKTKKQSSYLLGGVSIFSGERVEPSHSFRQTEIEFMMQEKNKYGFSYEAGFIYTNEAESFPYPNVPNAYFRTKKDGKVNWVLGRKTHDWSYFDSVWQLGLWQPNVSNNLIRPHQQGLTGAFLHYDDKPFKFTGFLTALYVPTIGPQFKVIEGQILSSNRWQQSPISSIQINGVDVEIAYDVKIPNILDVVNQLGVGFNSSWGKRVGPWAQLSMAYKPMNSLHVQFESPRIILDEENNLRSPLKVYPKVVMHSLATIELGWRSKRFNSFISITDERPTPPDLPDGMNQPKITNNQFIAAQVEHDLKIINKQHWFMQWGVFKRVENEGVLEELDDDLSVDFTDTRYPYSDAIMVGGRANFFIGLPAQLSTKFVYSPSDDGAALMTDMQLMTDSGIGILLSLDLIGSSEGTGDNFFNRYRNNDRFFGGISYAF